MKRSLFSVACLGVVFSASSAVVKEYQRIDGNVNAPLPGKILRSDMFADASIWNAPAKDSNYGYRLCIHLKSLFRGK